MRWIPCVLLVACTSPLSPPDSDAWLSELGSPDPTLPPPTAISLDGPSSVAVELPFAMRVSGALPEEGVHLLVASSETDGEGPCPLRLGGYCLDLSIPVGAAARGRVGADGTVNIPLVAPPYDDASHCYQAVIRRGVAGIDTALSNVVCVEYCPAEDADGDGICDEFDPCIGLDDLDTDGDGRCDDSDPCPLDAADDSDGDGVCDSDDLCPGDDDRIDEDGDGEPDCVAVELCSVVAQRDCEARGWTVVGFAEGGNIVCTIDGRDTGANCDTCDTYNIYVWEAGSEERHCPGFYSTLPGVAYSAHTPCTCGDNLDFCFDWDMERCIPD